MKDNEFLNEIHLQKKLFEEEKENIAQANLFSMMLSSVVSIALFGVTSFITPLVYKDWTLTWEYYFTLACFGVFFLIILIVRNQTDVSSRKIQIICGIYYISILMLLAMIDIFPYRSLTAAFIPIMYVALPIIFIFPYIFYVIVTLAVQAIFMFLVSRYKDAAIVSSDIFRSMVGATFSIGLSWIVLSIRTKEKGEKGALVRLSYMDLLTGVLNKTSCEKEAKKILNGGFVNSISALFVIDIDSFKTFNDELGHHTGDRVLMKVGSILSSTFRANDVVGRIGGDEFMVFMTNIQNPDLIEHKCQRISQKLEQASVGELKEVTCSIGVALARNEIITYETMFGMADEALYEMKSLGRNGFRVHMTDAMNKYYTKRLIVVADDSEVDRAVIKECFGERYDVVEAVDGREALQIIRENSKQISLVLLDLLMPVMSGYDVLRDMNQDFNCKNIPVVVISADKKGKEEALALGALNMLSKPIDPVALGIYMKNVLKYN